MFNLIRNINKNSKLLSNFSFLSILQIFQMAFPLILYPYLIRILGKDIYGITIYANAIIAYFAIFINFGFNISEIKDISIYRDNKQKVSEIISSVIIIRLVFTFISIIILSILTLKIPTLYNYKYLIIFSYGILIDAAINPNFYFQGVEKMKFITIITITSKLFFLILIFFFVEEKTDYNLIPLLTSIGALVGTFISLYIIFVKQKIKFKIQPIKNLKFYLKESSTFFMSRLSVILIDKTNIVLLGTYIGFNQVAYYDLADKIVSVMKTPFNIFNQVLFPNISKTKNFHLTVKLLKYLFTVYIFGYISIFFFGEFIITFLGGPKMIPTIYILYILGLSSITELVAVLLGAPLLLALGHKKDYNISIIYGSIFYIFLISVLYLSNQFGIYQFGIVTVLTSLFISLFRLIKCINYKYIKIK